MTSKVGLIDDSTAARIADFVTAGIEAGSAQLQAASDPFWADLRDLGTELWLDTGDLEAASELWTAEFSALTTNNTLLNAEVQKGIYDQLIQEAAAFLGDLELQQRIVEIAFILNARHGLRLVQQFGGKVSVELHTDTARDIEAAVAFGRRFYDICPEHFIVKVPLTPEGLIATRRLRELGVPINFTLGFSARQNYLAAAYARPTYVNVFLGRLGAYVADNGLGSGDMLGEKATLASQRGLLEAAAGAAERSRQIAASIRGASQLADLAGLDVYTIPVKVAAAKEELDGNWQSRLDADYQVELAPGIDPADARLDKAWEIDGPVRRLAASLDQDPPATGADLVDRAHDLGAGDLFPRFTAADASRIAADGKIPKHAAWQAEIRNGAMAIDSLLNEAGLASFTADQAALDNRIRSLIS